MEMIEFTRIWSERKACFVWGSNSVNFFGLRANVQACQSDKYSIHLIRILYVFYDLCWMRAHCTYTLNQVTRYIYMENVHTFIFMVVICKIHHPIERIQGKCLQHSGLMWVRYFSFQWPKEIYLIAQHYFKLRFRFILELSCISCTDVVSLFSSHCVNGLFAFIRICLSVAPCNLYCLLGNWQMFAPSLI